mmetsp:Transcript_2819/g.10271  ORF Transcript_2819/g.10271 Transcript_2819/m.10271 type:complete len:92 (+) Transcript_2819:340-615(+)
MDNLRHPEYTLIEGGPSHACRCTTRSQGTSEESFMPDDKIHELMLSGSIHENSAAGFASPSAWSFADRFLMAVGINTRGHSSTTCLETSEV